MANNTLKYRRLEPELRERVEDLPLQVSLALGVILVLSTELEPTLSVGLGARYYL